MYYVIPLTTYTKDRWKKYRKLLCCRIVSINSIARIDKILILHKDKIPKRWLENDGLLIPTPNEIRTVYNRVCEYISLSIEKSLDDYNKFYKNYEKLYCDFMNLFTSPSIDTIKNFDISRDESYIFIVYSLNNVTNLSFEDVKRILWSIIGKSDVSVTYDKTLNIITIKIHKNNKNILTFKKWYDSIRSTEEHK